MSISPKPVFPASTQTVKDKEAAAPDLSRSPATHKRRLLFVIALPILVIAITLVLHNLLKATQPVPPVINKPEKAWPVHSINLKPKHVAPQVQLLGAIHSPHTSTLSAAIGADVVNVLQLEGDVVTQGQILVELDSRDIELQLAQRNADVQDLVAKIASETARHQTNLKSLANEEQLLAIARRGLERERKLARSNVTSESQLDLAEQNLATRQQALDAKQLEVNDHPNRLAQLKAQQARAEALRDQAENDLQRSRIRAPFDGRITSVSVSPGERVRSGDTIVALYESARMEVRAQIPQRLLPAVQQSLKEGNLLRAQGRFFDQTFDLQLERLSGSVNRNAGGVDALFRITAGQVAPLNSTVEVTLTLPVQDNVYEIPVSGVYGTQNIYLIDAQQRLQSHTITPIGSHFRDQQEHILFRVSDALPFSSAIITQLPTAINGLKVDLRNGGHE